MWLHPRVKPAAFLTIRTIPALESCGRRLQRREWFVVAQKVVTTEAGYVLDVLANTDTSLFLQLCLVLLKIKNFHNNAARSALWPQRLGLGVVLSHLLSR